MRRIKTIGVFTIAGAAAVLLSLAGCKVRTDNGAWRIHEADLPAGFPTPGPTGEVVIKQYPAYRAAFVDAGTDRGTMNRMFRPLFNHIKKNDVSMTAPVRIEYAGEGDAAGPTAMAFYYGDQSIGDTGDTGGDAGVRVEDRPGVTVASLGLRGGYSDAHFRAGLEKLNAWLDKHADEYRRVGEPVYLGYNSPFVPSMMRYAEVQIPVEPIAKP